MEYTKNNKNFSFGFGSAEVAGIGKLSEDKKTVSEYSENFSLKKAISVGAKIFLIAVLSVLKLKFLKNKEV